MGPASWLKVTGALAAVESCTVVFSRLINLPDPKLACLQFRVSSKECTFPYFLVHSPNSQLTTLHLIGPDLITCSVKIILSIRMNFKGQNF
jgi:hypothetical protein